MIRPRNFCHTLGSYALTSLIVAAYLENAVPLPALREDLNVSNISAILRKVNDERISHTTAITFFVALLLVNSKLAL